MTPSASPSHPDCIFCRIVSHALPAAIVYEDETVLAFLDHRPVFKGHILLVPRKHLPTLADADAHTLCHLTATMQALSAALTLALESGGAFLAINDRISQSVPHLHIHIVPRNKGDGLRGFFWPRTKYTDEEERENYAARIRSALSTKS